MHLLLLEVPAVLGVDQYQVQEVLDAELVLDVFVRRSKVIPGQIQANRDTFLPNWRAVHYFELRHCLIVSDLIAS